MVYSPIFLPCHYVARVIIASVDPTMESKKETPQQMLGRALGGQQNTVTTSSSPGFSARSIRPSSSTRSSTSPLLDYVRRSQVEALAERTSARVRELQTEDEPDPEDVVVDEQERLAQMIQGVPMFTGVPLRSSMFSSPPAVPAALPDEKIPATTARVNITQRRSRGKARDDGNTAPSESLLSRRPRDREKDRRYSIESVQGKEDDERQNWRSATARHKPPGIIGGAYPQSTLPFANPESGLEDPDEDAENLFDDTENFHIGSSSSVQRERWFNHQLDSSAPFLREYIPPEASNPALHQRLTQLWYERQDALRGLGDALGNDDAIKYGVLTCQVEHFNQAMHSAFRDAQGGVGSLPDNASSSSSSQSNFRQVDDLPLVEPSRSRKHSAKDDSGGAFTVELLYQGVSTYRVVNDQMPMRTLLMMAKFYLVRDFGFLITSEDDLDLNYDGQILQIVGVLGDVPVLELAIIEIQYPRVMGGGMLSSSPSVRTWNHSQRAIPPKTKSREVPTGRESLPQHQGQTPSPQSRLVPQSRPVEEVEDVFRSPEPSPTSLDPRSYDKIRQSFKCPRFSGQAREWKQWDKGFLRYLSIWELDYVLDPSFFDVLPLTNDQRRDNKLVYFIIEDAVQSAPLAASYVRQVALFNGFEAYYTLHDGFVFAGTTTSTLLLNELSNFRFLPDETPTALCMRLEELFQELELLPGDAAVTFIDTQKIGYLVNALRHESEWNFVCSAITSAQIKGTITFKEACEELRHRCETSRAHELMDRPVKGKKVRGMVAKAKDEVDSVAEQVSEKIMGLISTMSKRHNTKDSGNAVTDAKVEGSKGKKKFAKQECLAADCPELTTFPLCPIHYHSLVSAKVTTLKLRNGYGDAKFDASSSLIVYPAQTPKDRLPSKSA